MLFEPRDRVMLTRYSGTFSSEDISGLNEFVAEFVARRGYIRSILDLTGVEAVATPRSDRSNGAGSYGRTPG
jgi:hypothetical protein